MRKTLVLIVILLSTSAMSAHPVPKDNHDRFIFITIEPAPKPGHYLVKVLYRLEVDETTVILQDMAPYRDQVNPALFPGGGLKFYHEFARIYAPIFKDNLLVKANGQPLAFTVQSFRAMLRDDKGEALGHVRVEVRLEAEFAIKPDQENSLQIAETNYRDQEGQVHLTLLDVGRVGMVQRAAGLVPAAPALVALGSFLPPFENSPVEVVKKALPDLNLNQLPARDRPLDFDAKLRNLSIHFVLKEAQAKNLSPSPLPPVVQKTAPPTAEPEEDFGSLFGQAWHNEISFLTLFRKARESQTLFWSLLVLFACLGAAHALTPGHGKTLVAAYLVGERGTIWHAVVLGLTTTITHTGVVLLIAFGLYFLPQGMSAEAQRSIQTGLGLAMGLTVALLGIWLLLQRLSGRADHVHLGSGHSHGHGSHSHGTTDRQLSWWGIILLGITGGLIPCWDAIAILVTVVGSSEFWFALPALLAFSAGLAGVLVLVGILVVQLRGFAGSRWGEGRFVRSLPYVSAILVTLMGLWLCIDSVKHTH